MKRRKKDENKQKDTSQTRGKMNRNDGGFAF